MAMTERRLWVKASMPEIKELELGSLIERLGPLNNQWRTSPPSEKVLLLWAMGDVLLMALPKPTDAHLWEIQRRSYITRVILRYALIVRRSWPNRADLAELVADLRNYTVFREALPFLKGNCEGIDNATYAKVLGLLRSANTRSAVQQIKALKSQTIGRQHKKGASVDAVRAPALKFSQTLSRVEEEIISGSRKGFSDKSTTLSVLSGLAVAVATGERADSFRLPALHDAALSELAEPMIAAVRSGPASIAAFRKVVGASRLMDAADLLNSSRTERDLDQWKKRHAGMGKNQNNGLVVS